jgi:hypothetical protein
MTGSEAILTVVAALDNCGISYMLVGSNSSSERFRRRTRVLVLGQEIWMPTPEDVIVTKLQWALLGNRSKDRDDARGVIAVQGARIDWDYVHRWCEQHGTRGLLNEIIASILPI